MDGTVNHVVNHGSRVGEGMETTVYINPSRNFCSRVKHWWKKLRLKTAFQHLGLLIALMVYTFAGGLVFRRFEYPAELSRINYYNATLILKRQEFIEVIMNNSGERQLDIISSELTNYERILQEAITAGIPLFPEEGLYVKWTLSKAVFFSSTVLTTIGYGNIAPVTTEGRAFCIAFALVGIPLTLTVIADLGRLFATTVSTVVKHIPPLPPRFRTSSYALSAVCFLFIYLAAGGGVFMLWEDDWTFFDGFYFCFITMTTIGFGDLVPNSPNYMLICTLYILVGLALTSTIIELVRRQYAQSWRQLQALRGPLAENFRKFADNAPGLDVLAFQQDLMKVLSIGVSMPRKSVTAGRDKKMKQKEWEEAIEAVIRDIAVGAANSDRKPPVVQIVIYETSV